MEKHYSYADDDFFNRHLGETIDYDWAGAVRDKTWRWWWSRFCYTWRYRL